jgi:hypothetical protein
MPYLNDKIYTPQELGFDWGQAGSAASGLAEIYGARQQKGLMKQQIELAKIQAEAAAAQRAAGGPAAAPGGGFLQKHGLKLAIGAGGLLVLFLVLKKKG